LSFSGDLYPTAGATSVLTTKGDMVDYDTARQRLAIGSANQILQVKSNLPSWETVDLADTVLTTAGDVLYENATPELARLPKGTQYNNLQMGSALPAWSASSTSIMTGTGDLLYSSGANTLARLSAGTQYHNLQQGASTPSWTASSTSIMTGTGDVLYSSGANTLARLAIGSTDDVLTIAGGVPTWASAGGGNPPIAFIGNNAIKCSTDIPANYNLQGGVYAGGGQWAGTGFPDAGSTTPLETPVGTDIKMFSAGIYVSQYSLSGTWTGTRVIEIEDARIYPTGTGAYTDTGLSDTSSAGDTIRWKSYSPSGSGTWNSTNIWIAYSLEATT